LEEFPISTQGIGHVASVDPLEGMIAVLKMLVSLEESGFKSPPN